MFSRVSLQTASMPGEKGNGETPGLKQPGLFPIYITPPGNEALLPSRASLFMSFCANIEGFRGLFRYTAQKVHGAGPCKLLLSD